MSVIITPLEQLEFRRPFTRITKESIRVKNPSDQAIAFKIKTTAPKQYCVRPNAGRIDPNSDVEVQILLQPFKEELPEDYKCKDKFLVQTAPITTTGSEQDITALWSQIEATDKGSIRQHKIKCVFLPAENSNDEGASSIHAESVATTESSQPQETAPSSIAPSINNETVTNKEKTVDLELKVALEKVAALEKQLADVKADQVLRTRNTSKKLASTVQPDDAVYQHLAALERPRTVEGYPPQVVLGVALLVFIITYLFF